MKKLLVFLFCSFSLFAFAQNNIEKLHMASGNYCTYPVQFKAQTPAPKGYVPFYISHYGRHGSRYMTSSRPYENMVDLFESAEKANALTPLGKDVQKRILQAAKDADKRSGELSPLGARQHQAIAHRMYDSFPAVFAGNAKVDAHSTTSIRVILSMSNFCQQLRALNPKLKISMDASQHDMYYLASDGTYKNDEWKEKKFSELDQKFDSAHVKPARLLKIIFSDEEFVKKHVNGPHFMGDLYNITEDMQCLDTNISFLDLWQNEELFDYWQTDNLSWYRSSGLMEYSQEREQKSQFNLLRDILDKADSAIVGKGNSADLRFGHDTYVCRLTALMQISGCYAKTTDYDNLYKVWCNTNIVPMAANLQLIFYRKPGNNEVLVKIMVNEQERTIPVKTNTWPYYNWKDVEAFYRNIIK